jgi:hypothetical protein
VLLVHRRSAARELVSERCSWHAEAEAVERLLLALEEIAADAEAVSEAE